MRLIGHLPTEASAASFSDFLVVQGVSNLIEREKEGWGIWIHSEDELDRAADWLARFRGNPEDPTFQNTAQRARVLRQQQRRLAEASSAADDAPAETGLSVVGPLTLCLVLACLAVMGAMWMGYDEQLEQALSMAKFERRGMRLFWYAGLREIQQGELWRLVTPIFLHGGILHLVFNLMALYYLGNLIEGRLGPWRLAILVLLFAIGSNLGQYVATGPNFRGISGVLYGLLGYAWIRGRLEPQSGLTLHPQTVGIMLLWFVLCLTGWLGPFANAAHGVGLLMGVTSGFLAAKLSPRQRVRK